MHVNVAALQPYPLSGVAAPDSGRSKKLNAPASKAPNTFLHTTYYSFLKLLRNARGERELACG